ncbi:hypothetical protein [Flammeovirga sp. SJP92]|uniref:hypothetical protein n=1 Tax=Flammeovirga sp. SJP92 TaxID=1775430 RepID=UPI000787DE67|nr:hypothetical protein [Flammeovirga sp. SJP92]KXX69922.1 hypothetical protein AVL50_13665 [Flammeovirga sp. SJP92]
MKIKLLGTLFFILTNINVLQASHQIGDLIIYNGDTSATFSFLLEKYLQEETSDDGKLFGLSFREGAGFNCWRGYQAIYLIENDSLFLTDILKPFELTREKTINKSESLSKMKAIFNDKVINDRVFIDWFTGNVVIPKGDVLRRRGAVPKTFEAELRMSAEKGVLYDIKMINNYEEVPNGISRRYNDKKKITDAVLDVIKKLDQKGEFDCTGHFDILVGTNGKISDVSQRSNSKEEEPVNTDCCEMIKLELQLLSFDIIKEKGVPVEEHYYVLILQKENGEKIYMINGQFHS